MNKIIESKKLKENNLRIISIEPSEKQYMLAVVKQFYKKHNLDIEDVKSAFDILNGSPIGGISINSMHKK